MNRTKLLFISAFSVSYVLVISMGITCFLNVVGAVLASYAFNEAISAQYPRFIPFCIIAGICALIALIAFFRIDIKLSKKFNFTKKLRFVQIPAVLILSIPLTAVWETLFDHLQTLL